MFNKSSLIILIFVVVISYSAVIISISSVFADARKFVGPVRVFLNNDNYIDALEILYPNESKVKIPDRKVRLIFVDGWMEIRQSEVSKVKSIKEL